MDTYFVGSMLMLVVGGVMFFWVIEEVDERFIAPRRAKRLQEQLAHLDALVKTDTEGVDARTRQDICGHSRVLIAQGRSVENAFAEACKWEREKPQRLEHIRRLFDEKSRQPSE